MEPSLLAGLVTDARGERLTPSHALKKADAALLRLCCPDLEVGDGSRARFAVRRNGIRRCRDPDPARHLRQLLELFGTADMPAEQVRKLLGRAHRLAAMLNSSPGKRAMVVRDLVEKVIIAEDEMSIRMRRAPLLARDVRLFASETPTDTAIELTAAVEFKRRGAENRLVVPGLTSRNRSTKHDPALIKAIARGSAWFEELASGRARSLHELAKRDGISRRYIRRLVNLAFLSPKLVEAVLQGRQPVELTATRLTELDLPIDWTEQNSLLAR